MNRNSPVDEIKSRLDIVEVIGGYIKLQKAGANYRAVCPFHSEKKPSFFVSPDRQIWHCFGGCSKGGDVFKFVMEIESIDFGDALRLLAKKAGVELKGQSSPEYKKWQTERQRLFEVCELATKFFETQLESSKTGKEAKKYFLDRGINEESIKKWRLGYAPDTWQGLSDFLQSRNYRPQEIKNAGLGLSSEKGSFYDRFRGRIIFPVFDLNSQVVGFGGRIFKNKDSKEVAKYVNTPQTLIYDKSRILYGIDKAKIEIRKKDSCILVEGYTDLIMVSQAGFENVVATSGTALTPFQLNILKRYSDNLLTAFDMDLAGSAATKRGIDLAQSYDFNIKVITMPQGLDPADLILKNPKEWQERVNDAKSIMDFYFESAFNQFDKSSAEGKKEIVKFILPLIKKIPNRIIQSHWLSDLSKKLQIKEEVIEAEMRKIKVSDSEIMEPKKKTEIITPKSRKELLEERLALLIIKSPELIKIVEEEKLEKVSEPIKNILIQIKTKLKEGGRINTDFFNKEDIDTFNKLALKSEIEEVEEKEMESELYYCLREILMIEIKNRLDQISWEIKKAEEEKDSKKIEELTKKFNKLVQEKCQI